MFTDIWKKNDEDNKHNNSWVLIVYANDISSALSVVLECDILNQSQLKTKGFK